MVYYIKIYIFPELLMMRFEVGRQVIMFSNLDKNYFLTGQVKGGNIVHGMVSDGSACYQFIFHMVIFFFCSQPGVYQGRQTTGMVILLRKQGKTSPVV